MKYLSAVLLLVFAIFADAKLQLDESDMTDKEMLLAIIECAKEAIETGLPEIGLPSHEPLIISENISIADTIGPYSYTFSLENMVVVGISWFNVTQFDEIDTEVPDTDVFNYTYYWKFITLTGDWSYSFSETEDETLLTENAGTITFEMDHVNFTGIFNLTKAKENEEGEFNELTLKVTTKEIQFDVTNLGILGFIIDETVGPILANVINSLDMESQLGEGIKDKLNRDWMHKPERVQALIDNCRK